LNRIQVYLCRIAEAGDLKRLMFGKGLGFDILVTTFYVYLILGRSRAYHSEGYQKRPICDHLEGK